MRLLRFPAALAMSLACARLLAASAEPLPYKTEPAFKLKFDQPIAIVAAPGGANQLYILEKPGRIILLGDLAQPARHVFLDLTSRVGSSDSEQGVLALAFHPDFEHNRQFYVWYTSMRRVDGRPVREDRLSRFLVSAEDPKTADPASEQPLLAQVDDAGNHNGGQLAFGPDGYLYLSLGDEGGADDQYRNSQRIDKDFFSGILRLDVDRRPENLAPNPHPAVRAGSYSVPRDNPFVGTDRFNGITVEPAKVHTEFWAVGLRNPWRMAFDSATGKLWCADVGQNQHEEIDLIVRGGNYGWNFREGNFPFRGTPPAEAKFVDPIWDYPHSEGISVTGGFVYHGKAHPDLEGKYLFADFGFPRLWALTPDGDKPVNADRVRQIASVAGIVSFGQDPRNGDVLLASLLSGEILRLVR